ncbi:MAG: MlaD family protein [Candidatus Aceula meridiana]|nr:MlaD family protein [Candidatus Aceula meridiana]
MKRKNIANEFKVGLFVVICLLALFYMAYRTGKLDLRAKGYYVYVIFDEAAGLGNKAPVMLNGLEIGKVVEIKPTYEGGLTKIKLKVWLEDEARIREGSTLSIKMMGMMGEKYIQISSSDNKNFVVPETVVKGDTYVDLDVLLRNINSLVEENKNSVFEALNSLNMLLGNLNETVGENRESLTRIIQNFETTSQNFEEYSDDLKRNPWKLLFKTKENPCVK